jgi:5-methylcytosine-specific restriction endonuclease McrA
MSTKAGNHRGKTAYKRARLLVLRRDNYTCLYCQGEANQVDHVVPLATDDSLFNAINMENLVACCADCNRRKAAKPMRVFLAGTPTDRKSTRLNSSHITRCVISRMPSSA